MTITLCSWPTPWHPDQFAKQSAPCAGVAGWRSPSASSSSALALQAFWTQAGQPTARMSEASETFWKRIPAAEVYRLILHRVARVSEARCFLKHQLLPRGVPHRHDWRHSASLSQAFITKRCCCLSVGERSNFANPHGSDFLPLC